MYNNVVKNDDKQDRLPYKHTHTIVHQIIVKMYQHRVCVVAREINQN